MAKEVIADPQKETDLLKFWLLGAHKRSRKNDDAARRNEFTAAWVGNATAWLSALTATTIFTSFANILPNYKQSVEVLGILFGVVSTALATVSASGRHAEKAQKFRARAGQYKATIRELELIRTWRAEGREEINGQKLETQIEKVKEKLNTVETDGEAPVVPKGIDKVVEGTKFGFQPDPEAYSS